LEKRKAKLAKRKSSPGDTDDMAGYRAAKLQRKKAAGVAKQKRKDQAKIKKDEFKFDCIFKDCPVVSDKPIFSIIAPSVRSSFKGFYDNIKTDKLPFEIIWVGPHEPAERLPDNFRHIKTDVKPTQCMEIAAREATGEYLITGYDDLMFNEHYLEMMYWYLLRFNMDKVLFLNRFQIGRGVFEYCAFWSPPHNIPLTMAVFMIKRSLWNEMGGIDKRYDTIFWDVDFQLRCYERGMSPFIVPECLATEWDASSMTDGKPRMTERPSAKAQQDFTTSLWIPDGLTFTGKRSSPVQSFSDNDIMITDQ